MLGRCLVKIYGAAEMNACADSMPDEQENERVVPEEENNNGC